MRATELTYESAVKDLDHKLRQLDHYGYDDIDELMQRVSRRYKMTGDKLHNLFVHKYGHTPDVWIKKIKQRNEETMDEHIGKVKGGYRLYSHSGKNLGTYPSKAGAEKRERQVNYFKHVNEEVENHNQINDFINWAIEKLHIQKPYPQFHFSTDSKEAQDGHRTGMNSPDENVIWIYIGNRNLVDVFRTIFHELVHQRQNQLGMIKPGDSYPGSPIEAMADMLAGKYIKIYGEQHHEIFQ
jgi:hypothetical protein